MRPKPECVLRAELVGLGMLCSELRGLVACDTSGPMFVSLSSSLGLASTV